MNRDRTSVREGAREERTISAMMVLYCRDHHGDGPSVPGDVAEQSFGRHEQLCEDCAALLAYARRRLAACRYGSDKPTCAKCPTHCYKPAMREQVREVMRYSGPRMLRRHPVLAVVHLLDRRRDVPAPAPRAEATPGSSQREDETTP